MNHKSENYIALAYLQGLCWLVEIFRIYSTHVATRQNTIAHEPWGTLVTFTSTITSLLASL